MDYLASILAAMKQGRGGPQNQFGQPMPVQPIALQPTDFNAGVAPAQSQPVQPMDLQKTEFNKGVDMGPKPGATDYINAAFSGGGGGAASINPFYQKPSGNGAGQAPTDKILKSVMGGK